MDILGIPTPTIKYYAFRLQAKQQAIELHKTMTFSTRILSYGELFVEMDKRVHELALERNKLHSQLETLTKSSVSVEKYNQLAEERDALTKRLDDSVGEMESACDSLRQQRDQLRSEVEILQQRIAKTTQHSLTSEYYEYTLCVKNPLEEPILVKLRDTEESLAIVHKQQSGGVTTLAFRSSRSIQQKADISLTIKSRSGDEEFDGSRGIVFNLNCIGHFVHKYIYTWQIQYFGECSPGVFKLNSSSVDIPVTVRAFPKRADTPFVFDLTFESNSKLNEDDLTLWRKSLYTCGKWEQVDFSKGRYVADLLREFVGVVRK